MSTDAASLDLPVAGPFRRVKELSFEEAIRILLTLLKQPPPGFEYLQDLIPDLSDANAVISYVNSIIGQLKQRPQIVEYQTKNGLNDDEVKALHVYKCEDPYPVYKWLNAWLMSSRRDEDVKKAVGPFFIILNRAMSKLPKIKSKAARAIQVRKIPSLRATFENHNQRCAPGNQLSFWGFASFSTDDKVINSSQFMGDLDDDAIIFGCGSLEGVDMEPFAPSGMKEKEILPLCPTIFEVQTAVMIGCKLSIGVKQLDNCAFSYVRADEATSSTENKVVATNVVPSSSAANSAGATALVDPNKNVTSGTESSATKKSDAPTATATSNSNQKNGNEKQKEAGEDDDFDFVYPSSSSSVVKVAPVLEGRPSIPGFLYAPPRCDDSGFLKLVFETKSIDKFTHLHLGGDAEKGICSKITNNTLEFIAITFPKLVGLDLQRCDDIGDVGLQYISKLSNITALSLALCHKITDAGLEHIVKLSLLTSLDLSCCDKITDGALVHIAQLSRITSLDLGCCTKITDVGLKSICSLSRMNTLDLFGCNKITNAGLQLICSTMVGITFLNLSDCNKITDAGLENISKLSGITTLDIYDCGLITAHTKKKLQQALPNCEIRDS